MKPDNQVSNVYGCNLHLVKNLHLQTLVTDARNLRLLEKKLFIFEQILKLCVFAFVTLDAHFLANRLTFHSSMLPNHLELDVMLQKRHQTSLQIQSSIHGFHTQ